MLLLIQQREKHVHVHKPYFFWPHYGRVRFAQRYASASAAAAAATTLTENNTKGKGQRQVEAGCRKGERNPRRKET